MVSSAYAVLYVFQYFVPKNGRLSCFVLIATPNSACPIHSPTPEIERNMTHLRCGSGLPQRLAISVTLTVSMAGQAIGLLAGEDVAVINKHGTTNHSLQCRLKNRHLFHADFADFFNLFLTIPKKSHPGGGYSPKAMNHYLDKLVEVGIDTLLVCPNTNAAWYPSKVWPTAIDGYMRGDREFFASDALSDVLRANKSKFIDAAVRRHNNAYDLREAGIDWLAEVCSGCRQRGIAPWLSLRMNDTHGAADTDDWPNSPFHGRPEKKQKNTFVFPHQNALGVKVGLDYGLPEVRNHMLTLITELVNDYDFEGMEFDWTRDPICCEPPATEPDVAKMTEWHSEIRELARRKEEKTGKTYAVGIKCPPNIGLMRSIGLDVVDIARSGLIDFVSPSDLCVTARDIRYRSLKDRLGEGVAVYGMIEKQCSWLPVYAPAQDRSSPRDAPQCIEILRGDAASKLVAGADGVDYFNFSAAYVLSCHASDLKDNNNIESLRGREKLYGTSYQFGPWVRPLFESVAHFPALLEPGAMKSLRMPMSAEPPDSDLEVIVQVIVEKRDRPAIIGVSLNGSWPQWEGEETDDLVFDVHDGSRAQSPLFTKHIAKHIAYNFRFRTQDIFEGWNEVVILNGNLARCNGRNTIDNYGTMLIFAPYADRDYSKEERVDHSVVVAGAEVAIKKKTK